MAWRCHDRVVPWRPVFDDSRDIQLDPFRERAGRLIDPSGSRGWVFVRPWVEAQREGGHLWWRRWSPQREVSAGFVMLDGGDMLDDWVDQPEEVAREVRSWSEGRFTWRGVEYAVSWADADESRRVRDEVFQLGEHDG